jgi:NAD(P)-dependent dehydrogenase (short-subunit alcohol dehydrogenase family)
MNIIQRIWGDLKTPRTVKAGPVSLVFRLRRSTRVSSNFRRSLSIKQRVASAGVSAPVILRATKIDPRLARSPRNTAGAGAPEVAVIFGAGPNIGQGLLRQLAGADLRIAAVARNTEKLDQIIDEIREINPNVRAYGCDATEPRSVQSVMQRIAQDLGRPTLVTYGAELFIPGSFLDMELPAFEECWRHNCLGAFIVAREAATLMVASGRGTIVLIGATSAIVGRAGYLNLAVGKFGQRALAQVMARELGPKGVHVVHLIIDAGVAPHERGQSPEPLMHPDDIASVVLSLHQQPKSAWTHELDARPFNEKFWEHC